MNYGRSILSDVTGYVPGEQPREGGVIKLNTNENPFPPSPRVEKALRGLGVDGLRRYPDPVSAELRRACADRYGYPSEEWVIAGNGMDELLAMVLRAFVDPGDDILTPYPTYTLYETLAKLHGAQPVLVDLDDSFQLPESFFQTPARLCFLPRPNAPSGVCSPRADVEKLCESFDGVVVIDEAYADFAGDNCMDFPQRHENAIVMRSFSKSFSLAGIRLGTAVARPELIAELLKTKDSYNLNSVTQRLGLAAFTDYEHMQANANRVREGRRYLTESLRDLGFHVPPSQANFVLAEWKGSPSAGILFEELKWRNILVRHFPVRRLEHALRISVGAPEENEAVVNALGELVG